MYLSKFKVKHTSIIVGLQAALFVHLRRTFTPLFLFAGVCSQLYAVDQPQYPGKVNQISLQPWNVLESQIHNPSATGFLNNYATSLGYESFLDSKTYKVGLFIPISSAMLGVNYVSYQNASAGSNNSHLISTSYAKGYGDNFSLGMRLFSFINADSNSSVSGFTPGFYYRSGGVLGAFKSSFFRRWYLFASTNLLFQESSYELSRLGLGLDIFQNELFTVQTLLETEHKVEYTNSVPVIFGLNVKWKFIQLNSSYYYYNIIQNTDLLSIGLTFNPIFSGHMTSFRYEAKLPLDDSNDLTHIVSLSGKLGVRDFSAPVISVSPSDVYLSPNSDGQKEYIVFKIRVRDRSAIRDWTFEIKNSDGKVVRNISMDHREQVKIVRLENIVTEFFQSKIYKDIPSRIIWDGKGDPYLSDVNNEGQNYDLPDGKYYFKLMVTDKNGNKSSTSEQLIELDRSLPEMALRLSKNYVVLNSQSSKKSINIIHVVKYKSDSVVNSWLEDQNGKVVTRFLQSAKPTRRLSLDSSNLLDLKKKNLQPGMYTYKCELTDRAGHSVVAESDPIFIVSNKPDILVTTSSAGFSPHSEPIEMVTKLFHRKNLKEWRIKISPYKNHKVSDKEIFSIKSSEKDIEKKYRWDGKNRQGKLSPDGLYAIWSEAEYIERPMYKSPPVIIRLDSKGPRINAAVSALQFSPDQDGYADTVKFFLSIKDYSSINKYRFVINELIYIKGKLQRNPVKVWQAKGKYPKKIIWNGVNSKGLYVLGMGKYEYTLESVDKYGNRNISKPKKFQTGMQFFNTKKGLKVIIAQAKFNSSNTSMDSQTRRSIHKFLTELKKYPTYRVRIEAHTSNEGDEQENLIISEKRAKIVKRYMRSHGLSESRIGFQGGGEVNPIRKGPELPDLIKNDRVEFALIQ